MKQNISDMPIRSINAVKLRANDEVEMREVVRKDVSDVYTTCHLTNLTKVPDDVQMRYKYSNYLIEPNKHRFSVVVKVMAMVIKFIKAIRLKSNVNDSSMKSKLNLSAD